ncbi:hypothetical protein [Rickettsia argasii]|uniref:Uncharacterized protein n=1 Tax=Rickettsia argasii T170-B TaxID=1268837 RepID=A0A0F3RCD6_9RICK|nr:hypothetical protein [Rickettsia argasii]KJW03953.1 hypothetical protein RAT170B_1574 [Rickettsia argasii T170-B]
MSRDFLDISSTLAHNLKEYFENLNSDLYKIKKWFEDNIRGGDRLIANRSKVSAIWLYKQLKQYKSNILNQKLVKEVLDKQLKLEAAQIVDYFTSQQDSAKIILLYSKYKQGYKSLKTGQEVHRQASQLRKTINKSIATHLKVNLDIDDIKKIQDVQFKQKIFNKIHEQRLGIIKDYLKDIGYNKVTLSITIDEIKNIIRDNGLTGSKLGEYIEQIYNQEVIHEVISDTESEDTSYRTSDNSTNDRTEYNKLIKKIKHKAEEQLKKPINKVLLEINNNASQKHGLRIIKLYGINNLNIDLEVNEQAIINKVSIKRNGGSNKQDNHTVPVSTFLKSLEKNLKNTKLTEVAIKNLLHHYGKYLQDDISNPEQRREPQHTSEFDWIKDKIFGFDSKSLDQKLSIVEKYIIPFIFYEWNTRAEASFRAVKEATAYGAEGNLIKKINKQFNELIKSLKKGEIQSINNLKEKINEILPEYCKSIDLPPENQLTPKRFGVVISDARRLFKIWFSLLENVDKNLGLRLLLDSNGSNDYKLFKEDFFDRQKFGEQIIDSKQQLTRKQKQSLKNKLSEYIASNPETVDSGSDHSESDQSSSSGSLSPGRDEDVDVILEKVEQAPIKVEYTSDKIKLILQHYLPQKNIEQVYLIDAPDQYYNCVENLKQQLIWETKDKVILNDKFYIVIERPGDQSYVSSVIMLKLFNKNNKNHIKMLPVLGSISGSLLDEFQKTPELSKVSIKVDSIPDWFLEHKSTTNVYLNNLIEVIKLSIECNAPCKVQYDEIEEIMSESSIEYEKTHKSILDQVSRVSIGEQAGTSGILKRKGTGSDSPIKKVKFNLENLEEHRDNIGLQASGSGCSTRTSSKKRLKRDLCQEEETKEIFPYEPLEENVVESSKISARLYSQIAYLVALEHPEPTNPNIKPDNVLTYVTNIGDIISEGEINHSLREQELLQTHYREAQDFFNQYPKDTVLKLVGAEIDSSSRAWLFDNGKHSLLVSYDGHRYHIYSQDLNYRQSFQTKEGVRFTDIELYAEAFFKWRSDSIEYDLFTLKQNVPEEITNKIKQAKFWNPDQVVSDLVLLDKGSFSKIEEIPAKVVRELFFLDDKVPELTALHENFFAEYSGKISIRIEELHNVLSSLDPQASKSLVDLVKQHNFRVDTTYLNNMPESTKSLLYSYHNEVSNKLKTSESITIQDLSDLSWQIIADKMLEHPEISSELREPSLQSVKELHSVAATRAHALGITSQTLFFLPDIIRSMNTGNFEGLQKNAEMMLGDMAFNKMYDSLISKLGSVLPESRIALLKKLPLTSPNLRY